MASMQPLAITSRFIRGRNVLFAEADLGELYLDYYLHLKDNRIEMSSEADELLKSALAIFCLHCVSRPRNEVLAWTLNFQEPLLNLFLGGDTTTGDVVGRVFTEDIKKADENAFYQDLVRGNRPLHRSVVGFEGKDMIGAAEAFYRMSEQRPARFFQLAPERFAILAAHPDYDEEWFAQADASLVRQLHESEVVVDLETRFVKWNCGCNQPRIMKTLAPVFLQDPEALFLDEELIEVNCPRCAAKYRITREMLEAYVADQSDQSG